MPLAATAILKRAKTTKEFDAEFAKTDKSKWVKADWLKQVDGLTPDDATYTIIMEEITKAGSAPKLTGKKTIVGPNYKQYAIYAAAIIVAYLAWKRMKKKK